MTDSYYSHHYISNSDLKSLRKMLDPKFEDPADLKEIFEFGTLTHHLVLQPHLANHQHKDIGLATLMSQTVFKDDLCRQLFFMPDFRREYEFYRSDVYGVHARCKADGDSKMLSLCFEFKGLSVTTDKQFEEAIDRFDYDQAAAWYLDVSQRRRYLIAGVSKKSPDRIFKRIVDREHVYYKRGRVKVEKAVKLLRETIEL